MLTGSSLRVQSVEQQCDEHELRDVISRSHDWRTGESSGEWLIVIFPNICCFYLNFSCCDLFPCVIAAGLGAHQILIAPGPAIKSLTPDLINHRTSSHFLPHRPYQCLVVSSLSLSSPLLPSSSFCILLHNGDYFD